MTYQNYESKMAAHKITAIRERLVGSYLRNHDSNLYLNFRPYLYKDFKLMLIFIIQDGIFVHNSKSAIHDLMKLQNN